MTHSEIKSYHLRLGELLLRFDVDIEYSVEDTHHFSNPDCPGFVFARACTYLESRGTDHLIFDELDNGNLVESLKSFQKLMSAPTSIDDLSNVISLGGLVEWIHKYWQYYDEGTPNKQSEAIYDRLKPTFGNGGKDGSWYVYKYFDKAVFEIAIKAKQPTSSEELRVHSNFEPNQANAEIEKIVTSISDSLIARA